MDRKKVMRDLLDTSSFRGAIGQPPATPLAGDDDGPLQFAIGDVDGQVVIDFGTPVKWLGLPPQQAAKLASLLLRRARHVAKQSGETIEFEF